MMMIMTQIQATMEMGTCFTVKLRQTFVICLAATPLPCTHAPTPNECGLPDVRGCVDGRQ